MRCKNCHYSLDGLTEHRCPECGRGFNPLKRRTYLSNADIEMMRHDRAFWLGVLATLASIAVAGVIYVAMH